MGALLTHLIRKIAEGDFDYGKLKLSAAYWWLAGVKTWTGLVLIIAWFGLSKCYEAGLCSGCALWATWVLNVGLFGVGIGLVDAAFRARPPVK